MRQNNKLQCASCFSQNDTFFSYNCELRNSKARYPMVSLCCNNLFLYGQSVRFPASFPCFPFPVPFLYIARTKAVLTGLKPYKPRFIASVAVFKNGDKKLKLKNFSQAINYFYCLTACLYAKCCHLIGWIMERGPSLHFRIDGPDRLYGFQSKLKHRIFEKMTEKLSPEVVKN